MLRLNLISPELKQEIKVRRLYLLIKPITMNLIFFSLLATIYILAGRWVIESYQEKFALHNITADQSDNGLGTKYEILDSHLTAIQRIQADFVRPTASLDEIAAVIGSGIVIDTIRIGYKDRSINIKGWAGTREELLAFKDKLEASPLFEALNLPMNSIVTRTDINFDMSAKLSDLK